MTDPMKLLVDRFSQAMVKAFGPELAGEDPRVRPSNNPKFGDYQANAAMALGKRLGQKPRDIAQQIVDAFETEGLCESLEVAGPGFINVRLIEDFVANAGALLLADPRLGVPTSESAETVVIDYSSPNAAKEMHVGHLRSSIIGDALARTLEFRGHEVVRQNHIGDWGTQFGMLVEHLVDQGWSAEDESEHHIGDLNELYQEARKVFNEDPRFQERARLRVVKLQSGDEETLAIWHQLINESLNHFDGVYESLGITMQRGDVRGESFYNDRLAATVEELDGKGLVEESEGARCIFLSKLRGELDPDEPPMILQKKDGGFLYASTDMAAISYRIRELGAQRLLYVVGAPQERHFQMLFEAAAFAGWMEGVRAEHVKFGSVLGDDGKPFKTREGGTVRLASLLAEGVERATAVIKEKNPELPEDERARIAQLVGIGAIKYADLSSERVKDYVFNWSRMLAFEGNTAPYLQNAYVRIRSIFRKDAIDPVGLDVGNVVVSEPAERALLLKMLQFAGVVEQVEEHLEPHRLCTYLFELASAYHKFYETCPVLKAEDRTLRASRLRICRLTSRVLEQGLDLLGIGVPERM